MLKAWRAASAPSAPSGSLVPDVRLPRPTMPVLALLYGGAFIIGVFIGVYASTLLFH